MNRSAHAWVSWSSGRTVARTEMPQTLEGTVLYFAYGSNMNPARMRSRGLELS